MGQGKNEVMFRDGAGWAYFVSEPLKERLGTRELRTILVTGLQDYAHLGRQKVRNPESLVRMKIRVPKERVLVKTEIYKLKSGDEIRVKKYAIAGGIFCSDIARDQAPEGGRYLNKGLNEKYAKREL